MTLYQLYPSDMKDINKINYFTHEFDFENNRVNIVALVTEYGYMETKYIIGFYDFEEKQGRIILPNLKEFKYAKSLKALYSAIWRYNNNASVSSIDYIMDKYKQYKKEHKQPRIKPIIPQERYDQIYTILTQDCSNGIKESEEELRALFAEATQLEKSGNVILKFV